ncbi:hypothetical protein MKX01_000290, partial [Papaver californicum]
FRFKNRTTYDCLVNVSDGSLESMVCIPHKIVEKHYFLKQVGIMSDLDIYGRIHEPLKTELRCFQV